MTGAASNRPEQFKHLALIGCGKMGSALLQRWAETYKQQSFTVIEPGTVPAHLQTLNNIAFYSDFSAAGGVIPKADIVVLAIKPQIMDKVCSALKPLISKDCLILSIAAGRKISGINAHFHPNQPIIRVMPNTPAAIGKGISAGCTNSAATQRHKNLAADLMSAAGLYEWVGDESLMDAVTALSGSGPAYVFYLIEMLSKSGETIGLPKNIAVRLARQTVIGAAALAEQSPDIGASELRDNVTSPGGTTAAGLEILMDGRAQKIFDETLKAAEKRGKSLNK
jgi:pyrroline-5-carboxylate reductase